ncbi:hypothetical protein NKH53_26850 [Mesorhizobium australicum]|uniref:hypothetical protein n=1 Tax=Mesorhizobium australicum TaxID=536018 RepID=UPI003339E8F3
MIVIRSLAIFATGALVGASIMGSTFTHVAKAQEPGRFRVFQLDGTSIAGNLEIDLNRTMPDGRLVAIVESGDNTHYFAVVER